MTPKKLARSFAWALAGISYAFKTQRNMKIHGLAVIVVASAGFYAGLTRIEWAIISVTVFMVLSAETINTAIEKTVDLVTDNYHPLAELAKNLAAGAVLLTAINALVIAGLIFGHHFR
ncbi:MAG: diacylglycerol kinase family protein [Syntrophomonadaceae bacterium]|jgi:diacylglycerol kinase